jgi:uncharacterized protein YkwD
MDRADRLAQLTNLCRNAEGLSALPLSPFLMRSAQNWAEELAASCKARHSCYQAENVVWGQSSAGEALRWLLNSTGHRDLIMSDQSYLGVGCCQGAGGVLFWVQHFARERPTEIPNLDESRYTVERRNQRSRPRQPPTRRDG